MVTIQELVPTTRKRIALVAHDNKKSDLLAWARYNRQVLVRHELVATGTTGRLPASELASTCGAYRADRSEAINSSERRSQLGAEVTIGHIDLVLFFWDPLEPQPHDPDVRALLRIAVVWNVPIACNRATADYVISSPLLSTTYQREMPSYDADIWRTSRSA